MVRYVEYIQSGRELCVEEARDMILQETEHPYHKTLSFSDTQTHTPGRISQNSLAFMDLISGCAAIDLPCMLFPM